MFGRLVVIRGRLRVRCVVNCRSAGGLFVNRRGVGGNLGVNLDLTLRGIGDNLGVNLDRNLRGVIDTLRFLDLKLRGVASESRARRRRLRGRRRRAR